MAICMTAMVTNAELELYMDASGTHGFGAFFSGPVVRLGEGGQLVSSRIVIQSGSSGAFPYCLGNRGLDGVLAQFLL